MPREKSAEPTQNRNRDATVPTSISLPKGILAEAKKRWKVLGFGGLSPYIGHLIKIDLDNNLAESPAKRLEESIRQKFTSESDLRNVIKQVLGEVLEERDPERRPASETMTPGG